MADVKTFIGDFIQVYLDGKLIANGTDCKIDFKFGNVKTTTKSTVDKSNTYDYTDADFDISGSALFAEKTDADAVGMQSLQTIVDAGYNNQKFQVKFGSLDSGRIYYSGQILVVSAGFNAPQKAEASINYSFKGDGKAISNLVP